MIQLALGRSPCLKYFPAKIPQFAFYSFNTSQKASIKRQLLGTLHLLNQPRILESVCGRHSAGLGRNHKASQRLQKTSHYQDYYIKIALHVYLFKMTLWKFSIKKLGRVKSKKWDPKKDIMKLSRALWGSWVQAFPSLPFFLSFLFFLSF